MKISIIVAVAENNVIGKKNKLPWYLPADLKRFKEITMGHTLIMGQKTHESIGKPLPGRTNIVLSFDKNYKSPGCIVCYSLNSALDIARRKKEKEVFVIGGASVYKQFIKIADRIYLTKIKHKFDGDVFFPKINFKEWRIVSRKKHPSDSKNPIPYEFLVLEKKPQN